MCIYNFCANIGELRWLILVKLYLISEIMILKNLPITSLLLSLSVKLELFPSSVSCNNDASSGFETMLCNFALFSLKNGFKISNSRFQLQAANSTRVFRDVSPFIFRGVYFTLIFMQHFFPFTSSLS